MRSIIEYIKSCFCKHDWDIEECKYQYEKINGDKKDGIKVGMYCKKCGYHKSFWKF